MHRAIAEGQLRLHFERSLRTMDDLRTHGLTFSIDDFGTGYSSLDHLRTLPVDELTIDQSFVADLTDARSRAIVTTVLELGRRIDLDLAAEGIEDAQTVMALVQMGCPLGQGFHLARPLPPEDVLRRLQSKPRSAGHPLA